MAAILADIRALERKSPRTSSRPACAGSAPSRRCSCSTALGRGARRARRCSSRLGDSHYTTELGQFQIEANCDPQMLEGDGISRMHAQLDALVERAQGARERHGRGADGHPADDRKADLGLDNMVPSARYLRLNKIIAAIRGGKFEFSIKGLDELIIDHDSVMLEACNSSFQVHLQVTPAEFARFYNLAQVLARADHGGFDELADRVRPPAVGGDAHRAVPAGRRQPHAHHHLRETEARVSFGTRLGERAVRRDLQGGRRAVPHARRHRPRRGSDGGARRGEVPQLKALRLHNGTIYRWNRACYGITTASRTSASRTA